MNLLGSHDTPRLKTVAQGNGAAVALALTALYTFVGAPTIFYGDEIGLEGRHDPACRAAFPWDEPGRWDETLLAHVKRLGHLRRRSAALRRGDFTVVYADHALLAYQRTYAGERALVVLNSGEARTIGLPAATGLSDAFTGEPATNPLLVPQRGARVLL